jgi:predicted Zn-dependent protease
VVVHSGIVEALENEAQLAAVLGHEIAHSVQEHSWRQHEYHKKSLTALKIGGAFAAGMGYGSIADITRMVEGAIRNGYARSLENQSDRLGLEYMAAAGYDPREAPRVWKVMSLKFGNQPTNFFWSSHDSNDVRRSYLMAELRNNYSNFDFESVRKNETEYGEIVKKLQDSVNKKNRLKVKY